MAKKQVVCFTRNNFAVFNVFLSTSKSKPSAKKSYNINLKFVGQFKGHIQMKVDPKIRQLII
jgi:hypothetical protein